MVCICIIFFSFVFYGLDLRTKNLIKISEELIKNYEKSNIKQSLQLLIYEENKTSSERIHKHLFILSYTRLIGLVYAFFIIIGLLGILLSLCKII